MRILLTGGTGFIGKNIRESFLNEKYKIYAPTRNELDCSDDQSVEKFFSKHSFDVVIHSAAKPGHRNASDPKGILYTNSRMSVNLIKFRDSWGQLINMGSGAIYDMDHYIPKMKEEYFGKHIPVDEHGYNKYLLGLLYPQYKNIIDFRIFGIFGKYEDYAIRFVSNAICKTLLHLPITLRQNRVFDYLFIDDLMPIIDHFISHKAHHTAYNVTPTNSIELLQIAKIVCELGGNKNEIRVANVGLGREYSGDNSLLVNEIKSIKFTQYPIAIKKLFTWYHDNLSGINKASLMIDK